VLPLILGYGAKLTEVEHESQVGNRSELGVVGFCKKSSYSKAHGEMIDCLAQLSETNNFDNFSVSDSPLVRLYSSGLRRVGRL
jgi:hypothetical protein